MVEPKRDEVLQAIGAADRMYHRLVLLVGPSGTGKTQLLHAVASACSTSVLNLNLELSRQLLDLTAAQRAIKIPQILNCLVETAPQPVLLDNTELLFETCLRHDPLRLLQAVSRNRVIVAAWSGLCCAGRLTYAEPAHREYRRYEQRDLLIVPVSHTHNVE